MIRLSDSIGLSAFGIAAPVQEAARPATARGASEALDGDFLAGATSIGSDVDPSVRGSSVAQHAANVLWHLCGDAD